MAVYIGVDLHVRTETVCWMNTADGEIHQHTLDHSRDDLRAFYAQFTAPAVVGIESSGYALWFHQLMEQAGHRLLVGDAYAIRQFARRRQKNDRRDAELLLDLLRREEFPVVHRPAPPSQDTLALLRYRHRLVRMRTMVKNVVHRREPVTRFDRARRIAAYCGLDPSEHSSGDTTRYGHISKQGNRLLRFLLVEAAWSAVQHEEDLGRFFRRLRARKKPHAVTVVAVAGKLVLGLYRILRGGIDYEEFRRRGRDARRARQCGRRAQRG